MFNTLVSFVPNRLWLHQTTTGGGWADCFRDPFYPSSGAAWNVTGTRDAEPGRHARLTQYSHLLTVAGAPMRNAEFH